MNPTFPDKTQEEITIIFFDTFKEKTKEACHKATSENVFMVSKPLSFSLFDYLGIDDVGQDNGIPTLRPTQSTADLC